VKNIYGKEEDAERDDDDDNLSLNLSYAFEEISWTSLMPLIVIS
jgi:hypothetical protein